MRRFLPPPAVVLTAVALHLAIVGEPAAAACRVDPGTGETTCFLTSPPRAPRRTTIGHGVTSWFVWVQLSFPIDPETQARTGYCMRTRIEGPTTTIEYGNNYAVWLENAQTGAHVTAPRNVCLFPEDPNPEPPPPPPSPAEFVEAARSVLTVETSLNPRVEIGGLTGLDTWLWCADPGAVEVGVALRGWTAAATMDPVEFAWAVDGTDSASFVASSCGSESEPAASWMPETKGPYSVTLTTTWAGTWELAYLGFPAGVFPLGPYEFAAPTVAYPVGEYRGSLTPPGGIEP